MGFADGYSAPAPKRGRLGKKIGLRSTVGGIKHGGHTGHFNGFPGPHAAHPHNGMHVGGGHGYYPGSPVHAQHARATGYQGVGGDYAAAGPQQGFITGARGNFMPHAPGGY